ncbi:MAG: AI-2E family transporter [Planctomycetes bacterium]|nr:AI-2E family transporter [Planctomycetota bacterium]
MITLAATVFVVVALYLAKGVLIPFALAVLVSFLLAPLVSRLERWGFNRVAAVVTVVLLALGASGATGWLLLGQAREVTTKLSEYRRNIQDKLATLRGAVAKPIEAALQTVQTLGSDLDPEPATAPAAEPIQTVRIAEPVRGTFGMLRDTLRPNLDGLVTAAMALLFAFVMLMRRDDLGDRFIRIIGHDRVLVATRGLEEAADKVGTYLRRLFVLNALHGVVVVIGLTLIGVPNALLWGLLAAILRFVPYIGPWITATCVVLTAFAVSPDWSQPLLAVGLFLVLEVLSNHLVEPWLFGSGTGLSPLATVASALFWTWLWGPVGLLLSIPLAVCLVVMGKHVPQLRFLHLLFGDAPGLSPPARLYQRLIAGEEDQAWLVLRPELEAQTLEVVYDSIVLPALSLAEEDRQRGAFDEASEARIEETLRLLLDEAEELHASFASKEASAARPPRTGALRVLCLPARGNADALAACMLRQVLEADGVEVESASTAELSGETLDLFESRRVDIVCISAVPPSRSLHVRYLCKRIAQRFPRMPIIAGMWSLEDNEHAPEVRPAILAGVHVVNSLREARLRVRQLAETARAERAPAAAVDVATP